jgi:aminopeptidase
MSLEEYSEFLINSCYLDLDNPVQKWIEIDNEQKRLADILNKTSKIRIVGDKTDITFSTAGRTWVPCSGNMNFPDGEIFTSPVEDSATGTIYFDFPQNYHGSTSKEVYIKFENGKAIEYHAEIGNDFLCKMLEMDEGSKFVGEVAIGTNDRIQDVTGNILFDEKIGGSIHMAVGASYPDTGGKNVSGLHWDLIKNMKNGGEIYADDVLIYKDGKFVI